MAPGSAPALSAGSGEPGNAPVAPPLGRRLACLLYEALLLFGVLFFTALIYGLLMHQVDPLSGRIGLLAVLTLVLAAYFAGQWMRAGQTLPMRTWHIKLVGLDGRLPGPGRALARFALAAALMLLPGLALPRAMGLSHQSIYAALGVTLVYLLGYLFSSRWLPGGQFLHDVLCGTRLLDLRPAPLKA